MRVLLLTHYFSPESGAPQRRWSRFIREFREAGHEVDVYCPPPHHPSGTVPAEYQDRFRAGSSIRTPDGARVFRVGYLPHCGDILTRTADHLVTACRSVSRARSVYGSQGRIPDVIIATAPAVPTLMAGVKLQKLFGIPLVVEMRDAWPDLVTFVPGGGRGGLKNWVKAIASKKVTEMQGAATTIVTTTSSFAEVLRGRGLGPVEVIRNGVDSSEFGGIAPVDVERQGLRVLYMGTMGRSQGLEVVLRAVARLRAEGIDIEARLIGEGHERTTLESVNKSLGSPARILSAVPSANVHQHYAWADTTIVSLRDWQPFEWTIPSKLYELLAVGRHTTAILAGEGAEIIREVQGGDVVAPGDDGALAELWRTLAADRSRLLVGTGGRDWVREHVGFEKLARKYLSVLGQMADARS